MSSASLPSKSSQPPPRPGPSKPVAIEPLRRTVTWQVILVLTRLSRTMKPSVLAISTAWVTSTCVAVTSRTDPLIERAAASALRMTATFSGAVTSAGGRIACWTRDTARSVRSVDAVLVTGIPAPLALVAASAASNSARRVRTLVWAYPARPAVTTRDAGSRVEVAAYFGDPAAGKANRLGDPALDEYLCPVPPCRLAVRNTAVRSASSTRWGCDVRNRPRTPVASPDGEAPETSRLQDLDATAADLDDPWSPSRARTWLTVGRLAPASPARSSCVSGMTVPGRRCRRSR